MKGKTPKNIAASVRQRLLNKARHDKRPFNELLQYFAIMIFRAVRSVDHAGEMVGSKQ